MVLKEKKWTWSNVRCPKKFFFYLLWKLPFNSSTELMYTYNMSGTQNTLKIIQINLFLCLSFVSSFQIAIQSPCDRWQFSRGKNTQKNTLLSFLLMKMRNFAAKTKPIDIYRTVQSPNLLLFITQPTGAQTIDFVLRIFIILCRFFTSWINFIVIYLSWSFVICAPAVR